MQEHVAWLCLAGDMGTKKSARDVWSCTVCFVQIHLLEFEMLGKTKCWFEVFVCFLGGRIFCFLKYRKTTEAVEVSTETN